MKVFIWFMYAQVSLMIVHPLVIWVIVDKGSCMWLSILDPLSKLIKFLQQFRVLAIIPRFPCDIEIPTSHERLIPKSWFRRLRLRFF